MKNRPLLKRITDKGAPHGEEQEMKLLDKGLDVFSEKHLNFMGRAMQGWGRSVLFSSTVLLYLGAFELAVQAASKSLILKPLIERRQGETS